MKTAAIAITEKGAETALKIASATGADLHLRQECLNGKALAGFGDKAVTFEGLSAHVRKIFNEYDGLIFVMSLGIVNRVIAPMIKSKYTDPAVVCHDEIGRFVISVLSGHEGGANGLAYRVSSVTGAEPVVTTATEANRLYTCGVGCRRGTRADDIINAVSELRERGIEFLYIPDDYYDSVPERVGEIDEDLSVLKDLGILVDKDDKGYLLQIFTKPVQDRPTFFFEIIQRKGAESFGKGNFKALFVSIEKEQAKRGTL